MLGEKNNRVVSKGVFLKGVSRRLEVRRGSPLTRRDI